MLQNKQSIEQKSSQITENINEVRVKITDALLKLLRHVVLTIGAMRCVTIAVQ